MILNELPPVVLESGRNRLFESIKNNHFESIRNDQQLSSLINL